MFLSPLAASHRRRRLVSFALLSAFLGAASTVSHAQAVPPKKAPAGKAAAQKAPAAKGAVKMGTVTVAPPPGYEIYRQAALAMQTHNEAEAERLFRRLVREDPKAAVGWANIALLVAPRPGGLDEAVTDMRRAVALTTDPKLAAPFWLQLANFYAHLRRWPETAEASRKVIALDPKAGANVDEATAYLGMALLNEKRYVEAVPVLRKRKTLRGETAPTADLRLIYGLEHAGFRKEAWDRARAIGQQRPNDSNLQLVVGDLADRLGYLDEAEKAYRKAFALDARNGRAGLNVAIADQRRGRLDEAAKTYNTLIAAYPDDPRLHFQLGLLYYGNPASRKEQFVDAEKEFQTAAVRAPKEPMYITQLGLAEMMQGPPRYEDAGKMFQAALSLDPNIAMAHMGLGYIAEQTRRPAEAVAQYRTIIARGRADDDTARARRRLAGLLYAMGKRDESYREFEDLIARYPDARGSQALGELASLYVADKKLPEARKAYERLIVRNPKDGAAHVSLGQVLEMLKEPEAAFKQYETALQVDPKNTTAILVLGQRLKQQNKTNAALAAYEKFLATDPSNNQVRWQLATDYQNLGRFDDALRLLNGLTLQKNDPNRGDYLLGRPRLFVAQKKYDAALTELSRLTREYPTEDQFRYETADVEEKAGRAEAAEKTLAALAEKERAASKSASSGAPAPMRARLALAGLYERTNQLDQAAPIYEDLLRMTPSQPIAQLGLTRVRAQQKKPEAAGQFFEDLALTSGPTAGGPNLEAVQAVKTLYDRERTPERYAAFTRRMVEKYPNDLFAIRARVAVLAAANKSDERAEAMDLLRRLIKQNAADSDAHFQLGAVLEADRKTTEAIAEYTDAVQTDAENQSAIAALKRLGAPIPPRRTANTPASTVPGAPTRLPAAKTGTPSAPAPTKSVAAPGVGSGTVAKPPTRPAP